MYPFFYIFGNPIPTYGMCMLLGILLAAFLATKKGKRFNVQYDTIIVLTAFAMGLAIFCGYLFYIVVTYSLPGIIERISKGDFSFLRNTGIIFYGGLFGGIAGIFIGMKVTKTSLQTVEQLFVPFIPVGHAIGRIGCAMAGCCHGMKYDGPLAVYYPNSVTGLPPDVGYFPVQFLEAFLDIIICVILVCYCKKERKRFDILFLYLILYAVMRFITECFRGDAIRGVYFGVSTSQWISMGIVTVCVIRIIFLKFFKRSSVTVDNNLGK